MNDWIIIIFFSGLALILLGGALIYEEIIAQVEIEDYTEADKTVKFQRIQFEFFVLLSDIGDGDQFISNIELQRANKILKALPDKPKKQLFCDDETFGKIYRFWGSYVFKNPQDANSVKNWFKNNLPIDKIRYGEYYLLDNTHHWDNPQPDTIIEHIIYGNEAQYEQTVTRCLSSN